MGERPEHLPPVPEVGPQPSSLGKDRGAVLLVQVAGRGLSFPLGEYPEENAPGGSRAGRRVVMSHEVFYNVEVTSAM